MAAGKQKTGQMKASSAPESFFQKLTSVYLACMAGLFLLYTGGDYRDITRHKAMLFLVLTGGYLLVSLLARLELAAIGHYRLQAPLSLWRDLSLPRKLILLFWVFSLISTLLSVDLPTALLGGPRCEGFLTVTLYCWMFLALSGSYRVEKRLVYVFGGAVALNCILSVVQLLGANPLGLYPEGMNYYDAYTLYSGEFLGTLGNVDIMSAVFCVAVPVFALSLFRMKGKARFFLLIPLLLSLGVLGKVFVTGGVVGISFGALLMIPVLGGEGRKRRYLFAGVLGVLALLLVFLYFFGGRLGGTAREASELLHGRWNDDFGSGRLYIWRNTVKYIPERPLFGGGPDTLGLRMDAVFRRLDENTGLMIESSIDAAHNEYLNILVNQGALSLLAYLAAMACAAAGWIRNAFRDPAAAICGGAALCYGIQAFFGISSPVSAPYFWICLAFTVNRLKTRPSLSEEEK